MSRRAALALLLCVAVLLGLLLASVYPRVVRETPVSYPPWVVPESVLEQPPGKARIIRSISELEVALTQALPGDVLSLQPGQYKVTRTLRVSRAGKEGAGIVLRAERQGEVVLEVSSTVAFRVEAPFWRFENLVMLGRCAQDEQCEHAFQVVGNGHSTVIRGNRLQDFNAQIKVNGEGGRFPDSGVLTRNVLSNTRVRVTTTPVTPVDIVGTSGWRVERNLIADFIRQGGNGVSYGAFAKGGGTHNRFLRNVVLCEYMLRDYTGERVGLSLGGGGTEEGLCRDGSCRAEQRAGEIRGNLVVGCSDSGVDVNRATDSAVIANTLLATDGVLARGGSDAVLSRNLVDGAIRTRQDSRVVTHDNLILPWWKAWISLSDVRRLFVDVEGVDFRWVTTPSRLSPQAEPEEDLCGRHGQRSLPGAFEDFSDCLRKP